MKVLVTGGSGFLGQHVVAALQTRPFVSDVLAPRSTDYDLRDAMQAERMFKDFHADVVIHLAASVGGIGANRAHPGRFFRDNLLMGVHTLHEAWRANVSKFLALGTICSYPKFTPVPFREEELWNGYPEETNAPYGLAKKMLLVQAQAYRQEYGFNAIYLLPVNMYGPGDNFDLETSHVIPALIRKFSEAAETGATEVTLWGDGSPTREFLYVEDAARGIVLALERYDGAEPVNLGSGHEISIRDLASLVAAEVGYQGAVVWDTAQPNGQPRRCLDVSRAKEAFGFEATTSFQEGLRRTIEDYRKSRFALREVRYAPTA